jgi:hypothetical protein
MDAKTLTAVADNQTTAITFAGRILCKIAIET